MVVINDSSSTTLLVKSVDENDQQEYKLVISNPQETITHKTFLHVESKHTFYKKNENQFIFQFKSFFQIKWAKKLLN